MRCIQHVALPINCTFTKIEIKPTTAKTRAYIKTLLKAYHLASQSYHYEVEFIIFYLF